MSRSQSYRPRIPTHIIQLLDVASRITLFLVGQSGPLCFTFRDRLDNKYKTSIGPQLKCSCAPARNDHCIHTAYVFLKIFRVSVDNPIIWQAAYVDSELSDLLTWKHTVPEARRPRPILENMGFEVPLEMPSQFLKKKQKAQQKAVILCVRMKLQSDTVCPICQEAMTEEMCLSYCKVKCGNNFHLECLKIWAKHRVQEDSAASCPMCRCRFANTIIQELQRQQKQWAVKQSEKIKVSFNCSGCGLQNIQNNPHKCVLCTSYQLCECCYAANKHVKHPFIRRDSDGRWRGAEERREDELKIKNYIDSKRKQTYNDEILKKLRKIDEDPSKLLDYVASAYPYVSRYITEKIDPLKKMDFEPSEIKCFKCGNTRMLFLRRLSCGHFIDNDCLKDCILKEKYYCQEDGSQFLKGYQNLKHQEKEVDQKRNQQIIDLVPYEFNPSHLEELVQASTDYNFIRNSEDNALNEILTARGSRGSQQASERLQSQLNSHIIRENRQRLALEQDQRGRIEQMEERSRRQVEIRNVSRSRERPIRQRPAVSQKQPEIRIRNVGIQTSKNKRQAARGSSLRQKTTNTKKRQQMGLIIGSLIGRKLK